MASEAAGQGARTPFEAALAERFRTANAAGVDAVIALAVDDGPRLAVLNIARGALRFTPAAPDATCYFDSAQTALGILGGDIDPSAAFMAGRFRADANLPLVFVLLGLFRADYGPVPPP